MKEQDLIELELQQELREMFEVDTQNYLQKYLNLAQNLQSQTWQAQIQEMYRAIHTIKGGAVTVGADAILYVSTVLEDLLSDLRYLDFPPFLADGKLGEMLSEAGELLAGSISINLPEDEVLAVVNPTIERIKLIHGDIKQTYLPEWSEQSLLHQEFAEQGFDLVVLDLEMALENLANESKIPANTIEVATITLQQLTQIGEDLQLGEGWTQLVTKAQTLLKTVDLDVWRSQWFTLLADLKYSAKHSGTINSTKATVNSLESEQEFFFEDEGEFDEVITPETMAEVTDEVNTLDAEDFTDLDDLLAEDLDNLILAQASTAEFDSLDGEDLADLDNLLADELEEQASVTTTTELNDLEEDDFGDLDQLLPDELFSEDLKELIAQEDEAWEFEKAIASTVLNPQENLTQESKDIKISIPLSRLDKTAQNLVDSLLATRASQSIYTQLKSQLNHLFILAQENAKYITRLRQIQDEYANLNELKPTTKNSADGVILEQYRQGYITINRLLETSLRLSELGAEVAEIANQTENSLDTLERNILSLQSSVQESRLLPFQNLAFRARAIIRDLNNRYQKSVQLHIEGEQIELDAGTISQLEPALLHLLRNAFDHGIESSDIRTKQGKPPEGTIRLSLQRQGKNLLLTIKDDGQGINAAKISEVAGSQNLLLTDTTDNNKLLNVICQPGFSSRTQITDISGRGVGMDVVASQIESLGGKLKLETSPGVGTTFTMEIPPPTLLVPCLLVRSGDRTLAFPTDEITTTDIVGQLNLTNLDHSNYIYSSVVTSATGSTPVYDLLNYWNNSEIQRNLPETALAIYIQSKKLGLGVWFLADDLLGQRELLINSLPSPLKPPVGMMGLSLAQDGTLIPVLAPVNLAELILTSPVIPPLTRGKDTLTKGDEGRMKVKRIKDGGIPRTILIVDDAALMRRRLEVSLSASGYNVQACVDGLDAWNWLQNNEIPDLLITDIEMPEMDGFTLIDRCRQAGLTIPILVISSRLSEEWNKESKRVGANDYLTKGFATPDLLNKVNHLLTVKQK